MCSFIITPAFAKGNIENFEQRRPLSQMTVIEWKRYVQKRKATRAAENNNKNEERYGGASRRRNSSLPDITAAIAEADIWSQKTASKRLSLQRSQSVEWEPVSAIFTAITENDTKELERILNEYEIDLDFLNTTGVSPLHTAAMVGNVEAVQLLLDFGARVEFPDQNGRTTLEISLLAGSFDCAAVLISAGANMRNIIDGIQIH